MKKNIRTYCHALAATLLLTALTACTADEQVATTGNGQNATAASDSARYFKIALALSGGDATRSAASSGTDEENAVHHGTLYLFDKPETDTESKIIEAISIDASGLADEKSSWVVKSNTYTGSSTQTGDLYALVVLNNNDGTLLENGKKFSELKEQTLSASESDLIPTLGGKKYYLMTSAPMSTDVSSTYFLTKVTNVAHTAADARQEDATTLFVERAVAKIVVDIEKDAKVSLDGNSYRIHPTSAKWAVGNPAAANSYLLRHDASAIDASHPIYTTNTAPFYRTLWGVTQTPSSATLPNEVTDFLHDLNEPVYVAENTSTYPTYIVIKAQLRDESNTIINSGTYYYITYTLQLDDTHKGVIRNTYYRIHLTGATGLTATTTPTAPTS